MVFCSRSATLLAEPVDCILIQLLLALFASLVSFAGWHQGTTLHWCCVFSFFQVGSMGLHSGEYRRLQMLGSGGLRCLGSLVELLVLAFVAVLSSVVEIRCLLRFLSLSVAFSVVRKAPPQKCWTEKTHYQIRIRTLDFPYNFLFWASMCMQSWTLRFHLSCFGRFFRFWTLQSACCLIALGKAVLCGLVTGSAYRIWVDLRMSP